MTLDFAVEWRWVASARRTHLVAVYRCTLSDGCIYRGAHWGHRTYAGSRVKTACAKGPNGSIRLWLASAMTQKRAPICKLCWHIFTDELATTLPRVLESSRGVKL